MIKNIEIIHYTDKDVIILEELSKPLDYFKTYCKNLELDNYSYLGFKHISNKISLSTTALNHDIIIFVDIVIETDLSNDELLEIFSESKTKYISWRVRVVK